MIASEAFFLKLENQISSSLPFVAWRSPFFSSEIKALLQKDSQLHEITDYTENGFVFAPFDAEKPTFYIPQESSEEIRTQLNSSEAKKESSTTIDFSENEKAKSAHISLVKKGVEAIEAGKFQKVVLSRKELVSFEQLDAIFLFKKMLEKYPTAFVYIFFHPKVGLWLGATPETLLKVERNKFKTMALAGTQKFNGTTDVPWGEKEKEEQQIVTFLILENLKTSGISEIKTSEPYTAKAGNLLHIKTDIEGFLENKNEGNLKKVISSLHPTPAVCGLPKEASKKFILENENYDREFYTGFLGELNMKSEIKRSSNRRNQENQAYGSVTRKTSLFVNLRCMKIEKTQAAIFVGGGITKGSDPEAEWEETANKAETMKAVF